LKYFHEFPFSQLLNDTSIPKNLSGSNSSSGPFISYHAYIPYVYSLGLVTFVVTGVDLVLSYFLIAAIVNSYNKVTKGLAKQKYLSIAEILHQNSNIFKRGKIFKHTRYIMKV
jgi:hypothetical protein